MGKFENGQRLKALSRRRQFESYDAQSQKLPNGSHGALLAFYSQPFGFRPFTNPNDWSLNIMNFISFLRPLYKESFTNCVDSYVDGVMIRRLNFQLCCCRRLLRNCRTAPLCMCIYTYSFWSFPNRLMQKWLFSMGSLEIIYAVKKQCFRPFSEWWVRPVIYYLW